MEEEAKKYLGIDWGEKRIGLAMGDGETGLALPFVAVSSLEEVLTIMEKEAIDVIVLGQPRKMSGQAADNPRWLEFHRLLQERSGRPVYLADERLSSLAADSLAGKAEEKAGRDETAAAIILQDYLDMEAS